MQKKEAGIGEILASAEYTEAKSMLSRFEKLMKSEKAEKILEGAEKLEQYFEVLKERRPDVYGATDSDRKRIAERMLVRVTSEMVAID